MMQTDQAVWTRVAQKPGSERWNPKKSKNMEINCVQPQETEKRRSVVLNNDNKSKNMKAVLVQLQKIQKCESDARYNEEKSKNVGQRDQITARNPKTAAYAAIHIKEFWNTMGGRGPRRPEHEEDVQAVAGGTILETRLASAWGRAR